MLLDSSINASGSSTQQPFVMPDGKYLLYASDKSGGYGGFDIWYAELDAAGKPVRTANLGEMINTASDEQAPYYHALLQPLFFPVMAGWAWAVMISFIAKAPLTPGRSR